MSFDFGGHEENRGDCYLYSIYFEFEWFGEPTFRDVLDDCSASTSGYEQTTFASEAGVFSGDFAPDNVLMASSRMNQFNDPPNQEVTKVQLHLLTRLLFHW